MNTDVNWSVNIAMRVIVKRLECLPQAIHTVSADNSKEFAEHQLIGAALEADIYFADPYSAWRQQ